MLCENPKTKVAAKNSWKSRGKFKNLFLVRVRMFLTLFCYYVLEDCVIISISVITTVGYSPAMLVRNLSGQ